MAAAVIAHHPARPEKRPDRPSISIKRDATMPDPLHRRPTPPGRNRPRTGWTSARHPGTSLLLLALTLLLAAPATAASITGMTLTAKGQNMLGRAQ
ncbi:MAG: hypothetical protein HQL50_13860, partial [Magnetococcales bacterium]|nr:hypothetical protein [Magnetococcales bacterium]